MTWGHLLWGAIGAGLGAVLRHYLPREPHNINVRHDIDVTIHEPRDNGDPPNRNR